MAPITTIGSLLEHVVSPDASVACGREDGRVDFLRVSADANGSFQLTTHASFMAAPGAFLLLLM